MKKEGLLRSVPHDAWEKDWIVNSQAVGNGERSIRYLSSYVFRTAISDRRIINKQDGTVCFRYIDTKSGKSKMTKLKAFEFIRRFLQHVLPQGFMKIRYYGFMHPSSRILLKAAVVLLDAFYGFGGAKKKKEEHKTGIPRCCECNTNVRYLYFISPQRLLSAGFT